MTEVPINPIPVTGALDLVRRRWRLRRVIEGGVVTIGALILAVILNWLMARWLGAGDGPVVVVRRLTMALVIIVALWRLSLPWRRPLTDRDVALYLEHHEPSLGQAVLTAVDTGRPEHAASEPLRARVIGRAQDALARIDAGRGVERPRLRRSSGLLAAVALGFLGVVTLGPSSIRQSTRLMFDPWRPVPSDPVFSIDVDPGTVTIPKGGSLDVRALLQGFSSEAVELVVRRDSSGQWERVPMTRDSTAGAFRTRLFDLVRATEYFAEAEGIRSPTYRVSVTDLPTVDRLAATVQFPRYTGLAPEVVVPAGDLAVLAGSTVMFQARTTRPARAVYLTVDGRPPIAMTQDSAGQWRGSLPVRGDGFYRIELEALTGERVRASVDYTIDALEDAAPTVAFTAPGRDTKVTSVEEITAQAHAADDFGVQSLELRASVNGGPERVIVLSDSTVTRRKELDASHTFFLEELTLKPGDVVSYYAKATDGLGQTGASDLYFLAIRPFDRSYRQAEQGGGGGGGQGESAGGLSERQRDVVVATFNVIRDSASHDLKQRRENVTTVAISEGRLREEVSGLLERLGQRRLATVDSTFALIATELEAAVPEMQAAEEALGRQRPDDAIAPEQRALQHLQRAEAAYREVQVSMGGQSGGGGQGKQPNADELADLFQLETDKLENQYESMRQENRDAGERALDETMEKLRRLASRQQQENERMQRMADALRGKGSQSGGGGGGGSSQRQLAQEAEEEARRLERLARERSSPDLADAARRLREAAEAMRRAAANGGDQGSAQGQSALDRLKNAERQLNASRAEARRRDIQNLVDQAEKLRDEQRDVGDAAGSLPSAGAERGRQAATLGQRKDELAQKAGRLEAELDRLARESRGDQPKAAARLEAAGDAMRKARIKDKLAFSKNLLRQGSPEYIKSFEGQLQQNLSDLANQVRDAAGSLGETSADRQSQALERARDLVRGLESLRERAQARGQQGRGSPNENRTDPTNSRTGAESGQPRDPSRPRRSGPPTAEGTPSGTTPNGRMDAESVRQFVRELRVRRQAGDSLRGDLAAMGENTEDLDRLLGTLRTLESARTFEDPRGLDRLQQELIEGLKNLEFALWRKYASPGESQPSLGAGARVPTQYRALVEEYYRSLARKK